MRCNVAIQMITGKHFVAYRAILLPLVYSQVLEHTRNFFATNFAFRFRTMSPHVSHKVRFNFCFMATKITREKLYFTMDRHVKREGNFAGEYFRTLIAPHCWCFVMQLFKMDCQLSTRCEDFLAKVASMRIIVRHISVANFCKITSSDFFLSSVIKPNGAIVQCSHNWNSLEKHDWI